ncbi:polysaccharide deacetylase family protein [Pseudonocardia nigra]|uniref:polysaccharide deacetylase family protein n=1 Tax=Pseudonocardia nigra TaxID=1921578 RepID=UPI001C5D2BF3|nr:polysaccharide deacetylase family protein [Pseudonocardia nigra]
MDRTGTAGSVEVLGFPPDARVLIVNADDFGMYGAINTGALQSIEDGIVGSCSLMVPCPGASEAMELLRRKPEIAFGIHLTLVCELTTARWGPMAAAKDSVPSLLDEAGELFGPDRIPELLARARLDDVGREFRAQIDAVVGIGLEPTHLDWHCLADAGRPDVFDLTVALADEYGLAVRAWGDRARTTLRRRGLPVVDHDFVDSFGLDLEGKAARYAALLRHLPVGLTEWAVHPGLDDEQARAIDPGGWPVRHGDHGFLTSPEARAIVAEEGIAVIGYREVQRAWTRARVRPTG